jgi:hypothetical protein
MAFSNNLVTYRADRGTPFTQRTGAADYFGGNPELFRQKPKYAPEIQQNINDVLQQGFEGLKNPYAGFQNIANEAVNRYETQGVPSLAERFTSLGGGQRSSAFTNALASQRGDLERSLAALQENFGRENRRDFLQQIGFGLKNQPDFEYRAKQPGFFERLNPFGGGSYEGIINQRDIMELLTKLLPAVLKAGLLG